MVMFFCHGHIKAPNLGAFFKPMVMINFYLGYFMGMPLSEWISILGFISMLSFVIQTS